MGPGTFGDSDSDPLECMADSARAAKARREGGFSEPVPNVNAAFPLE